VALQEGHPRRKGDRLKLSVVCWSLEIEVLSSVERDKYHLDCGAHLKFLCGVYYFIVGASGARFYELAYLSVDSDSRVKREVSKPRIANEIKELLI